MTLRKNYSGRAREKADQPPGTPLFIGRRIMEEVRISYIRYNANLYDHTIQVIDTVESYRDIVSGMHDTYLSSVNNRMNAVMKILTILATIFIPLTFVTGIYGMNFRHMPELFWEWGYYAALGLMLVIAMIMLAYFRKKKWI